MRNISFSLTTDQVRNRQKEETCRLGWWKLKPGDRLRAVEKCMGLKKGEKVKPLTIIEIVSTKHEPLNNTTKENCIREGFPNMEPEDFIKMFCEKMKCRPDTVINRIRFQYIED